MRRIAFAILVLLASSPPATAENQWPDTERLALFKAISDKCGTALEYPEAFYSDALEPPFWRETKAAGLSMQDAFAKLDSMVLQAKPTIEGTSCDHLNMALRQLLREAAAGSSTGSATTNKP
jgi:hypothetical protein